MNNLKIREISFAISLIAILSYYHFSHSQRILVAGMILKTNCLDAI